MLYEMNSNTNNKMSQNMEKLGKNRNSNAINFVARNNNKKVLPSSTQNSNKNKIEQRGTGSNFYAEIFWLKTLIMRSLYPNNACIQQRIRRNDLRFSLNHVQKRLTGSYAIACNIKFSMWKFPI